MPIATDEDVTCTGDSNQTAARRQISALVVGNDKLCTRFRNGIGATRPERVSFSPQFTVLWLVNFIGGDEDRSLRCGGQPKRLEDCRRPESIRAIGLERIPICVAHQRQCSEVEDAVGLAHELLHEWKIGDISLREANSVVEATRHEIRIRVRQPQVKPQHIGAGIQQRQSEPRPLYASDTRDENSFAFEIAVKHLIRNFLLSSNNPLVYTHRGLPPHYLSLACHWRGPLDRDRVLSAPTPRSETPDRSLPARRVGERRGRSEMPPPAEPGSDETESPGIRNCFPAEDPSSGSSPRSSQPGAWPSRPAIAFPLPCEATPDRCQEFVGLNFLDYSGRFPDTMSPTFETQHKLANLTIATLGERREFALENPALQEWRPDCT